jgi:hypothetical protein
LGSGRGPDLQHHGRYHRELRVSGHHGGGVGISIVAAAGPVLDATNQVSAYNGDATHGPGFTAGTDIAANAKTYAYIAVRSADPRTQTAGVASGASA